MVGGNRPQRFPRRVRLLAPGEYGRVFSGARKVGDPCFTMLSREHESGGARLGLAISKKCARHAVDRNRIKRMVREGFRRQREILPSVDIVVMCRPGTAERTREELHQSLDRLWQRLRQQWQNSQPG